MTSFYRAAGVVALALSCIGCAALGPSVVKFAPDGTERSKLAILRADASKGLTIIACDEVVIQRGAKYLLLEPGRHEVWFYISGQTLFSYYEMRNKIYLEAEPGRTYILTSKKGGILMVGDDWFPEVVDVTDDAKLHVAQIPQEERPE